MSNNTDQSGRKSAEVLAFGAGALSLVSLTALIWITLELFLDLPTTIDESNSQLLRDDTDPFAWALMILLTVVTLAFAMFSMACLRTKVASTVPEAPQSPNRSEVDEIAQWVRTEHTLAKGLQEMAANDSWLRGVVIAGRARYAKQFVSALNRAVELTDGIEAADNVRSSLIKIAADGYGDLQSVQTDLTSLSLQHKALKPAIAKVESAAQYARKRDALEDLADVMDPTS